MQVTKKETSRYRVRIFYSLVRTENEQTLPLPLSSPSPTCPFQVDRCHLSSPLAYLSTSCPHPSPACPPAVHYLPVHQLLSTIAHLSTSCLRPSPTCPSAVLVHILPVHQLPSSIAYLSTSCPRPSPTCPPASRRAPGTQRNRRSTRR